MKPASCQRWMPLIVNIWFSSDASFDLWGFEAFFSVLYDSKVNIIELWFTNLGYGKLLCLFPLYYLRKKNRWIEKILNRFSFRHYLYLLIEQIMQAGVDLVHITFFSSHFFLNKIALEIDQKRICFTLQTKKKKHSRHASYECVPPPNKMSHFAGNDKVHQICALYSARSVRIGFVSH